MYPTWRIAVMLAYDKDATRAQHTGDLNDDRIGVLGERGGSRKNERL